MGRFKEATRQRGTPAIASSMLPCVHVPGSCGLGSSTANEKHQANHRQRQMAVSFFECTLFCGVLNGSQKEPNHVLGRVRYFQTNPDVPGDRRKPTGQTQCTGSPDPSYLFCSAQRSPGSFRGRGTIRGSPNQQNIDTRKLEERNPGAQY